MKLFRYFVTSIVLVGLFLSNTGAFGQQELTSEQRQALFLTSFFKYSEWPNEANIAEYQLGVLGDEGNQVYNELIKITDTLIVKDKKIKVNKLSGTEAISNVQLLFLDKSTDIKLESIKNKLAGQPTLFVTRGYPFGQSMINFIVSGDQVHYEISEKQCEEAGIKINFALTMASVKSEKQWEKLITRIEDLTESNEETVEVNTKELAKIVSEQKRLLSEISANTKKLEDQKEKLKAQQDEIVGKEAMIANAKREINEQQQLISSQLAKIEVQEQNLANLNTHVMAKQQELAEQQRTLELEKEKLLAIQQEYADIEVKLKEKERLVNEQGKTIEDQVGEIFNKSNKIKEQESIIWLSVIFLIVVSILGALAFRSYRLKKKANETILSQKSQLEQQHKVLEEQHREITDSINYAKRIQTAILPPLKLVRGYMPDSFILYKPKDIVAGDFYWMEGVNNLIIFAAADCTGHGVPGAMVSVVCNNAINRAVKEFMLVKPNEILDKTREIVMETFEKSDEDVNDGMDIALCSINTESKKLHFSGANNGMYLIRNGELTEIKPDKQPIGNYRDHKPFTLHEHDLQKGDVIYTFSDGYPDQFGGPKGKKFMYKNFKELLLEIHQKPMDEQHHLLVKAFEDWKGGIEQIDDVCVIGVRI
ncbi:MAG: DUF4154 domain-containing protein [Flavobacteriales bacterium]|nr:DUF4154 domain-containing protein [Flavobacteriales bacterium]